MIAINNPGVFGPGPGLPRLPGVGNPVAPDLPGVLIPQQGTPGDVNDLNGGQIAEPPEVNIDNISLPAGLLDRAGNANMRAGVSDFRNGNLGGAAHDFQAAAADYERAADLLIAQLTGRANAQGGGANPLGGGAPPPAPAPALPAPFIPTAPAAPAAPATAQSASPWTVKTNTLDPAKGSWSSVGDPHETTGDGLKFDNQKSGKFDLIQSASGDFRVQNDQEPDATGRWKGATLNQAVAVKDGNDKVSYSKDGTLNVNGTIVPLTQLPVNLPGGGKVEKSADGLTITSSKGDIVNVHQKDGYIDLDGHVGPNRKDGEVRGALGEFHDENDVNRDLKGRTGDDIIGKPGDAGALDKFEENWRAQDDIFPKVNPSGGGSPVTSQSSSPAWTVKTNSLTDNNTFASVGDPHETTGDGLHFDNEKTGQFTLLQSANKDLVVQNDQGPDTSGRWPGATLNHGIAIKDGNDMVQYKTGGPLTINGQQVNLQDGQTVQLPGGGSVTKNGDTIKVLTSKKDEIDVKQQDQYLDITGKLGDRKDGEVRGALGEFHMEKDVNRDLKGPTGDDVIGLPTDPGAIDKFEEAWRVPDGTSLFNTAPAGGGAQAQNTGGVDPAGGGAPVDDANDPTALNNMAALRDQIRAAIAELNKAATAHTRAARQLLRAGDRAGAAKEFQAAAADNEKAAQLLTQNWPAQPAAQPAQAQAVAPAGGTAPATTTAATDPNGGGLPAANPAPQSVHRHRVRHHHHRGFLHRLAHFAGGIERTILRQPGAIFNPVLAPVALAAGATANMARGVAALV